LVKPLELLQLQRSCTTFLNHQMLLSMNSATSLGRAVSARCYYVRVHSGNCRSIQDVVCPRAWRLYTPFSYLCCHDYACEGCCLSNLSALSDFAPRCHGDIRPCVGQDVASPASCPVFAMTQRPLHFPSMKQTVLH